VASQDARLVEACRAIRTVERYVYSALADAEEGSDAARAARDLMRLTVGLRRKLDTRHDGSA